MSLRLDVAITQRNILASRAKAQAAIKAGLVQLNGKIVEKCSEEVCNDDMIVLTAQPYNYVSRAGEKLEKAIIAFGVDVNNKECLDIGASTGGFTDCLINHGAKEVTALDVGTMQLDEKLRADSRVISLENTDIREYNPDRVFDIITSDVSFISETYISSDISRLLAPQGIAIVLIKPQFECGRAQLNKNGVVTSKNVHIRILKELTEKLSLDGLFLYKADYSPIRGKSGNIEYLFMLTHCNKRTVIDFKEIVENAHKMR